MTQYEKIRRYVIPVDQNSLLFITTESELSNQTFIQNTLELVEVFKKTWFDITPQYWIFSSNTDNNSKLSYEYTEISI